MKLEWFSGVYSSLMKPSKEDENYNEWMRQFKRHLRLRRRFNTMCAIDRCDKYHFNFETTNRAPLRSLEYRKVDFLKDLMYQRAEELTNKNNTIQFFWSGGVDSTAALLVLKDICPKDQLLIQMTPTSIEENPVIWNRLVKNFHHNIYTGDHLFEVANTKNVVVECGSADTLWNSTNPFDEKLPSDFFQQKNEEIYSYGTEERYKVITSTNAKRRWYMRMRFAHSHKRYRFFTHSKEDKLNLNNINPFYDTPNIEQYFMNKIIDGTLTHTDRADNIYLTTKPELRDIIREYDKDVGDNLLAKLSIRGNETSITKHIQGKKANFGVIAITETGKIIRKKDMIKKTPTAWGSPTIGLE